MNKIEKNDSRSLKREKLRSFLSERRSQKETQVRARKETARRLISERRARLVSERISTRQRKEALQEIKIKSRVKINAVKSDKTVSLSSRPELEKRKVFTGDKTQSGSGKEEAKPSFSAFANNQQAKNRQKLLSYLEKYRVNKSEIIAGKIKQKKAAAVAKQARQAERQRQKQSLSQQKLASQSRQKAEAVALLVQKRKVAEALQAQQQKEAGVRKEEQVRKTEAARAQKEAKKPEIAVQRQALTVKAEKERVIPKENVPTIIGQPYLIGQPSKRQQLLSYLKKRKAGEQTFAVQRLGFKKSAEAAIPGATLATVVPELIPIIVPVVTPPTTPLDIAQADAVPEKVLVPEVIPIIVPVVTPPITPLDIVEVETVPEKVLAPMEEKPAGRRLKLPLGRGKKIPSDTALTAAPIVIPKPVLPPRKPFRIVPFLKAHFIKIIFLLLVLLWFVEIAMLNKRLENVSQQLEQASSIGRPRVSSGAITEAKISPPNLGKTRVEGIRDPFSNELWRIQEITPAQARAVGIRPVKIPAPSPIIRPIIPILIIKPPEFTLPEVARAIPESEKLTRIPQVTVPQAGSVSTASSPVSSLRFRGILNVAGIDYFFIEGARGGYRVRVGDTVEGFKIYDYRNGVLYFAKDGDTYQLNEEKVSPPLRYRGRMIMAGQEYFFLEGQRTYRAVIGEELEGYRLIKRVGDYLYFVKDDRLYYLKQE